MGKGHTSEEVTRRQLAKLRQFLAIAVSLAAVFSLGHAWVWRATADAAFGRVSILIALYLLVVARIRSAVRPPRRPRPRPAYLASRV